MNVKRSLLIVVLLALAAGAAWIVKRGSPGAPDPKATPEAPVAEFLAADIAVATKQALEISLPLTGTVAPLSEALVKARIAGEISSISAREGEPVRRGAEVARIDPTEANARVAARTADVEAARAQLSLAEKNRSTQQALLDKGFISRNAFDSTASSYDVAAARLRSAEAELATARKALADTVLVSPIDGVVAERFAQPGERVAVDARVLSIVDLSRLELTAAVPGADIVKVRIGQAVSVEVEGHGNRRFVGRIERINPAASTGTRSIEIYAVIENPERLLRAGLFARGSVLIERIDPAVVVPATAVRDAGGQKFVYTVDGGAIARRAVTTGVADSAGNLQILSGLAGGERVIRNNLGALREGAAARVADAPRPGSGSR